jgi:hypothetical protein
MPWLWWLAHRRAPTCEAGAGILAQDGYSFVDAQPAEEDDLLAVHDAEYIFNLKKGLVEIKKRRTGEVLLVKKEEALSKIKELIDQEMNV